MVAKTLKGLEAVLADELRALGAFDVEPGHRMVSFGGDLETLYQANLSCRTALRILKPFYEFEAGDPDELYDAVKAYDWGSLLTLAKTFSIDTTVYSDEFTHSRFVTYRVKDAIVDWFKDRYGEDKRPGVRLQDADVMINVHISGRKVTLSLDSSGESLHKRGWRTATVDAPMNEILAAGLVMLTGWKGDCDFIDPMCGSGTIAIEACMLARNIAPGRFRSEFAFEKWPDFNADMFDAVKKDCDKERPFEHMVYAYDVDPKAVAATKANVEAAGLDKDFAIACADFRNFTQPAEKALMVINPPYGVRISPANLLGLYRMIGERLKHQFTGNEAWIISNHEECFDSIGLKPSIKIPLYNGSLDCQFQKYQIFDGKLNDFRRSGKELKSEEERRTMAEKHRFKENREFKKKIDAASEEDYGDIPDYVVRKHLEFEARRNERDSRDRRNKYNVRDAESRGGDFKRKGDRFERKAGYSERNGDYSGRNFAEGKKDFSRGGRPDRKNRDGRGRSDNDSKGKRYGR